MKRNSFLSRSLIAVFILMLAFSLLINANGDIAAAHVYHNHMPNFWPYFNLDTYTSLPVGQPVRYTYDGQVILLKENPPSGYNYYLPDGQIMPHDDLVSYYSHHAKYGAYQHWPMNVANELNQNHPQAQMHVTMSASVVNNVNNIISTNTIPGHYNDSNWGQKWEDTYTTKKTSGNKNVLDMIHFTGHHSMGPLVGDDYFIKDLIYHNVTLSQDYFLGDSFQPSDGFFPTELGFSERLIPSLKKLGIKWSVLGNVHYSRTLTDYPYLNDPGVDMLISPPNRADLQNEYAGGDWKVLPMFNEQHDTVNKFPFASVPHYVRYVDPATGEESRVVGVPVEQAGSWEEGYEGRVTAENIEEFNGISDRPQFFVVAHDGDNSSGRAGSEETWFNAGRVTYSRAGTTGMGIDEYLARYPVPENDVVHVQDGSWIDTRDSASDPMWYHWHVPFGVWKDELAPFNAHHGTNFSPQENFDGIPAGMSVSYEYGYGFQERNYAMMQAALNYAKTAEQIWLDDHPAYWSPSSAKDNKVTFEGNQLNPYMISYPVKGDEANDYAGGANPAELAWYFLLASMDSGFCYYGENIDDIVKPALAFNQSIHFARPYVEQNSGKDKTGPSLWWVQRYPYNPGSVNNSRAEGYTTFYFDNTFSIYTYGFDVNDIADIKVKVRTHRDKTVDPLDNTCRVYDPAALKSAGVSGIDPGKVGEWSEYAMNVRDLYPDKDGIAWRANNLTMKQLPATEIGDLYYAYINDYRDQLLDYYVEAVDSKGNVTRSEIQQVYVGAGRYTKSGGKYLEDLNGEFEGVFPFMTANVEQPPAVPTSVSVLAGNRQVNLDWNDGMNADSYIIYFTDDGTEPNKESSAINVTVSEFVHTGLTNGLTYSYKISASNEHGHSGLSSMVSAIPERDDLPPSVPQNIVIIPGNEKLTLNWDDAARAASYTVYYTDNGLEPDTSSSFVTTTASSLVHTGLTNGLTYRYKISASNVYGTSALSVMAEGTPLADPFKSKLGDNPELRMAGIEFANWDPANSEYELSLVADYVWEKEIGISSALSSTPYKLILNGSWSVNWGGGAVGTDASLSRSGADARVTLQQGTYVLRVTEGAGIDDQLHVQWLEKSDPKLSVNPEMRDFGDVPLGENRTFSITCYNSGGGSLMLGTVSTSTVSPAGCSEEWLTASKDGLTINVSVSTAGLDVDTFYEGVVSIASNGGTKDVVVRMRVFDDTAYPVTGNARLAGTVINVSYVNQSVTTDSAGNYGIELPNGEYTFTPSKAGYTFSPASQTVIVNGAPVVLEDFVPEVIPVYSVAGTILDESGSPLVGVKIGGCTTAADGSYLIKDLADGTSVSLAPVKAGYTFSPASRTVTINGSDVSGADFTGEKEPEGGITVHFYKPSNWAGPVVKIHSWQTNSTEDPNSDWPGYTMTDEENGWYAYTFKKAASSKIVFNNNSSPQTGDLQISGTAGGHYYYKDGKWITIGDFTISGSVLSEGTPLAGVVVTAGGISATTGADGSYTISGLGDGAYEVKVSKAGYSFVPSSKVVTIAGSDVNGADFSAQPVEGVTIYYAEFESAAMYYIHCWDGLTGDFPMTYDGYYNGKHWWKVTLDAAPGSFKFCFKNSNGSWDGGNRIYNGQAGQVYSLAWDNTVYTARP